MDNVDFRTTSITVGISFHKGNKWFKKTLDSVLSQTLLPTEIIILDDGTTPELNEFLKTGAYSTMPVKIYEIKVDKNLDISQKYNQIIEMATQKWVQIIDQDDHLYENFYEAIEKHLDDYSSVIASGMRSNLKPISIIGKIVRILIKDGTQIKSHWPILGSVATRSGLIYNSQICKSVLFSYPTLNGTDVIHLDHMRKKGKLIFVPSALVHYEIHNDSFSKSKSRSLTPKGLIYSLDSQLRFLLSRLLR